jgi:putative ABC transport system permease protein
MQRHILNFLLAIEGVMANRLRAVLTGLGIMFGVGAVIAMLAIGTGARQAILEQMKLIGTNNIVIRAVPPQDMEEEDGDSGAKSGNRPWSPGLNLEDVAAITNLVPSVDQVSPEILIPTSAVHGSRRLSTRVGGVSNAFFELNNLTLERGSLFHEVHMEQGMPVCIIGQRVEDRLFSGVGAIGKTIKCGSTWLQVVGVLKQRQASEDALSALGLRDYNDDVFVPITTTLLRFKDRSRITKAKLGSGGRNSDNAVQANYHQLDRLVIRVREVDELRATSEVVGRLLSRRHREVPDYEIEIPELLIAQQQKTQDTFNLVLAAIAGISLLVGGIGIMNIMLASVLERIKEIGIRRSLGATRLDIVTQFLFEAVFISLIGGVLGIFIGVVSASLITTSADIPTVVSGWSIFMAFGVAATVGLVFGSFPAKRAAQQDPIKALRSE